MTLDNVVLVQKFAKNVGLFLVLQLRLFIKFYKKILILQIAYGFFQEEEECIVGCVILKQEI
jgi:hypothetical protein